MIRVDAVWMAVEPLDMRAGNQSALARVVAVFGSARPHHACSFANRRANRLKVLVHDGIGVWPAARTQRCERHTDAQLYDVEREMANADSQTRLDARQRRSLSVADAVHQWMRQQRQKIPHGPSATA